jgi:hypothetical protein
MQRQEQERKSLINKLQLLNNNRHEQPRSFGGFKAEVVEIPKTLDSFESLKKYLGNIRKLKQEQLPTIVAEPLISIPTTSISTIYMSGSVPGQYSTSLVIITLDEEGNPLDRRRRELGVFVGWIFQALVAQNLGAARFLRCWFLPLGLRMGVSLF